MTTRRLISVILAVAALAAGASQVAVGASPAAGPPATLRGYTCSPAVDPALRGLSITAVMGTIAGTEHLRMRFDLLRAITRNGRPRAVHGPNLGRWLGPADPTLGQHAGDVWQVSHPVVGLARPGYYRMRVTFAWVGSAGRRLATATRSAPACLLRELRPDLVVAALRALAPGAARQVYAATIRNRGATASGAFEVQLRVAGRLLADRVLASLAAHAKRRVRLTGTPCARGQAITVIVDPQHHVQDYDRANNSLTIACPR